MLYFYPCDYFVTVNSYLPIPLTFLCPSLDPSPIWWPVCSLYQRLTQFLKRPCLFDPISGPPVHLFLLPVFFFSSSALFLILFSNFCTNPGHFLGDNDRGSDCITAFHVAFPSGASGQSSWRECHRLAERWLQSVLEVREVHSCYSHTFHFLPPPREPWMVPNVVLSKVGVLVKSSHFEALLSLPLSHGCLMEICKISLSSHSSLNDWSQKTETQGEEITTFSSKGFPGPKRAEKGTEQEAWQRSYCPASGF